MRIHSLLLAGLLLAGTCASAQTLQRFIIERDIPGASRMTTEQLRETAAKSNQVLYDMGPNIQWVQSFVAGDKIYCVYNAPSEAFIRRHAERTGFPANRITPVAAVIDPTTARIAH